MTLGTIAILVLLIYVIGYFPSVIIIAMIDKRIPSDVDLGDRYSFSAGMAIIWFLSIPIGLFYLFVKSHSFSFVLTYVEKVHFWIESKLERK
jgi:hypothetical protein